MIHLLQAGAGNAGTMQLVLLGGMILVFYFFMIRPQAQKAKKAKEFQDKLQKGDKIVTIAGIHGTVFKVNEDNTINVAGFTDIGVHFAQPNVPLIQDDEPAPEVGLYAEWMPYQKATAAASVTNGVSGGAGSSIKPL